METESSLSQFVPQKRNSNKHTERGLAMLEKSIQQDGFIGAMTSAADGEIFDGSARLEKVVDVLPANPIVVESDGTRPIIIKRTDIPNAEDPRAKRLSVAANRIAEIDLQWDEDVLQDVFKGFETDLFTEEELGDLISQSKELLKETIQEIKPRKMLHILISVPVEDSMFIKEGIEALKAEYKSAEVEYGSN